MIVHQIVWLDCLVRTVKNTATDFVKTVTVTKQRAGASQAVRMVTLEVIAIQVGNTSLLAIQKALNTYDCS